MSLKLGDKIPDLTLPASGAQNIGLRSFKGKALVVYFYPKDNTPGCTQEAQDFRDLYAQFVKAGADILGVSRDSVKAHDNFITKHEFPFSLLSDGDEAMCKAFDVIKEKSLYGRKYLGIERSTFLFDGKGVLKQAWRGVKVKNHATEVLEALRGI